MRAVGFFCEHPLQGLTHAAPETIITHTCPKCGQKWTGEVRKVLHTYQDHVWDTHTELLEDCGCCGGQHFPEFDGDCREDWERF
jgi:hypothetical protein